MRSFTDKILRSAEKDFLQLKKSGRWWQGATKFDQSLQLTEKALAIANVLFGKLGLVKGYKIDEKRKNFEILIANLINRPLKPVRISLNSSSYKKNRYTVIKYSIVDEIMELLLERNLIEMKKGFYFSPENSRMTRIAPTDDLLKLFPLKNDCVKVEPVELVILRQVNYEHIRGTRKFKKIKKDIDYTETKETERIRKILKKSNEVNSKADIRYLDYKLHGSLVAIFENSFDLYGRLHTRGYRHYQGYSEEERAKITINGNPVIEYDFKALHPFLLYSMRGIQYPLDGDPYMIFNVDPDRKQLREFLKTVFMILVNTSTKSFAIDAVDDLLDEYPLLKKKLKKVGINAEGLIDRFIDFHHYIEGYFCSDKKQGLKVMNKDSKIALDIIRKFSNKGITILAVHDSFIVEEQHGDELYRIMKTTYRQHTGGFEISVK